MVLLSYSWSIVIVILTIWSDSLEIKLKLILKSKEYITTTHDLFFIGVCLELLLFLKE